MAGECNTTQEYERLARVAVCRPRRADECRRGGLLCATGTARQGTGRSERSARQAHCLSGGAPARHAVCIAVRERLGGRAEPSARVTYRLARVRVAACQLDLRLPTLTEQPLAARHRSKPRVAGALTPKLKHSRRVSCGPLRQSCARHALHTRALSSRVGIHSPLGRGLPAWRRSRPRIGGGGVQREYDDAQRQSTRRQGAPGASAALHHEGIPNPPPTGRSAPCALPSGSAAPNGTEAAAWAGRGSTKGTQASDRPVVVRDRVWFIF